MKLLPVFAVALLCGATACTQAAPAVEDLPAVPAGTCHAEPAQTLVGRKATAAVGAELLRATGARALRWVPPRTAVTMDYRADRLTVGFDDDYTITRITCG